MPILSLPYDVLSDLILPLLPPPSLLSFSLACKQAHSLVYSPEDSPRLFRTVYLGTFDPPPRPEGYDWRGEVERRWRARRDVLELEDALGEGVSYTERGVRMLERRAARDSAGKRDRWGGAMRRMGEESTVEGWVEVFESMQREKMPPSPPDDDDDDSASGHETEDKGSNTLDYLTSLLPSINSTHFPVLTTHLIQLASRRPPPQPRTSPHPSRTSPISLLPPSLTPTPSTPYSPTHLSTLSHLLALLPTPPSTPLPTPYRSLSLAHIYSFTTHSRRTAWGPLLPRSHSSSANLDEAKGWKTDWRLVRAIYHCVGENVREWEEGARGEGMWGDDGEEDLAERGRRLGVPRGLEGVRAVRVEDKAGDGEWDWAGVEGRWTRVVCFMDYVDLFAFNFLPANMGPQTHTNPNTTPGSSFHSAGYFDDYVEATRILRMRLTISHYLHRPDAPEGALPVIFFTGIMVDATGEQVVHHQGGSELSGNCERMDDGGVRWRFTSRRSSTPLWSSEAVQPFGPRSKRGLFGFWTGVDHADQDPIGPFWMWKDEVQDEPPAGDDHEQGR